MNTYEKFFESIATFNRKQIQQRQRGLNNYNILTSVLKPTDEVRLHSGMIKSLLDIDGDHYQNSLFLNLFLNTIKDISFSIDVENCSVYKL
ncbi:PD-(D/E)XK nuclease family protein, partial [Vibrio sp. F12]|uniref:PD-(D/E)XK nuclease family protein n=1 Tax=Vibrio sp. F12 TaxID=2070776 RepID=UPI001135EE63